jgi:hypothetical protein
MKRSVFGILIVGLLVTCCVTTPKEENKPFEPIKTIVPQRPAGQEDVLQLTTPKLETVRVGFVGLGMRGPDAVERFTHIPGTQVVALCDVLPENVEKCQEILRKAGLPEAAGYSGDTEVFKQLCERNDIDLVDCYRLDTSRARCSLCNGTRQTCSYRSPVSYISGRYLETD